MGKEPLYPHVPKGQQRQDAPETGLQLGQLREARKIMDTIDEKLVTMSGLGYLPQDLRQMARDLKSSAHEVRIETEIRLEMARTGLSREEVIAKGGSYGM